MPQGDKGKHREEVDDMAGFGFYAAAATTATTTTTERDIQVPNNPAVERAMPGSPERQSGVVVGDAAGHVLWRVDTIDQGPETEETPGDEKFEPDDVQIEVGHHAELGRGVEAPVGRGLGDGYDVDVVQDEFHAEEGEDEPHAVEEGAFASEAEWCVSLLRDVVVEREDGAGEVQWGIQRVCDVVARAERGWLGRDIDAVSFRQRCGIELFLLCWLDGK